MKCIGCASAAVSEQSERTAQGYRQFRCRACGEQFNERSAGSLNRTQYPSDVIALVVLWRLRYKLSLRDLPEIFLIRGIVFSHEAVRDWDTKLTPAMAESPRQRRRGNASRSWYVDETHIKVHGNWRYLYRAMAAAKAFLGSAKRVTGITPDRVTTDGHDGYPRAIRTTLGAGVRHRVDLAYPGADGPPARRRQVFLMASGSDALDQLAELRPLGLEVELGDLTSDDCLARRVKEARPFFSSGLFRQNHRGDLGGAKPGEKPIRRCPTDRELLHRENRNA
jgi:putative transposase